MAQAGCQLGTFPDHPAYAVRFHVSAPNITRSGGADLPGMQGANLGIASASYQKMWLTSDSAREYGREWRVSLPWRLVERVGKGLVSLYRLSKFHHPHFDERRYQLHWELSSLVRFLIRIK